MAKPKKRCVLCKRERGNLSWKDWQGHLRACENKRAPAAGTPSIRTFAVPRVPHCSSSTSSGSISGSSASTGGGDGEAPATPPLPIVGVRNQCDVIGGSAVEHPDLQLMECQSRTSNLVASASESSSTSSVFLGDGFDSRGDGVLPVEVQLHVDVDAEVMDDGDSVFFSPSSIETSVVSSSSNVDLSQISPPSSLANHPDTSADIDLDRSESSIVEEEHGSTFDPKDPSSFCCISTFPPSATDRILAAGPNQPNESDLKGGCFPAAEGRRFSSTWYFQKLSDGTLQKRKWLSYSEKTDKIYCVDCILFAKPGQKKKHPGFTVHGFQKWKNVNQAIIEHETGQVHVEASITAELRKISLPLNAQLQQERLREKFLNREVVRQLIDITLFLAQHCLAFRGHREGHLERIRGNFRDLVALLGNYSPALATYLGKMSSSKKKLWNFLSWKRQNQYIKAIADFIKNQVQKELQAAHFFSVSFDESLDASRKEQCSCIIRYVRNDTGTVAERLVALKASASTTGEKLFEVLKSIFEELELDWTQFLVGQSYDGASNMRGAYQGLQSLVREKADSALYVWCWAHRLSLAVKEAADCCLDSAELFSNLKALYNLINGSKNNVDTYENIFKKIYPGMQILALKRVETTRWMSHSFALTTVLRAFDAIIETLETIEKTGTGEAKAIAHGLLSYFLSEKFLITALTFQSIFKEVEPLSTSLQAVDLDLMAAADHVEVVLKALGSMRSDEAFTRVLEEKGEFLASSAFSFTALSPTRRRRVRTRAGERGADEPIEDPLLKIKVETYFASLDNILNLISERFSDRAQGIFKDLGLFTRRRMKEVAENPSTLPKDAFEKFAALYGKFVNINNLRQEYPQFCKTYPAYESAYNLPEYLHDREDVDEDYDEETEWLGYDLQVENEDAAGRNTNIKFPQDLQHSASMGKTLRVTHQTGLRNIFPEMYISLRIAVTLPVTSASTERSFSKLKLIKTRLRSTMGQDRLEDLMIISCENDIDVDKEIVISKLTTYSSYLSKVL